MISLPRFIASVCFAFSISSGVLFAEETNAKIPEENLPGTMELYRNYIDANGGRSNLTSLTSLRMKGRITLADGGEMDFTLYRKRPQKMRVKIESEGYQIETAFDGKQGWREVLDHSGASKITEVTGQELENLKSEASIDGPFFESEGREDWMVPVAEEEVRGRPAIRLLVRPEAGLCYDEIWLDAESYQEIKLLRHLPASGDADVGEVQEIYFSGFEKVAGVWFAKDAEYFISGESTKHVHLDEVRANVGIFDSFFERH